MEIEMKVWMADGIFGNVGMEGKESVAACEENQCGIHVSRASKE